MDVVKFVSMTDSLFLGRMHLHENKLIEYLFWKGVEKEKACKLVSSTTRITHASCWTIQEVDMPYCEGSCNTYTK